MNIKVLKGFFKKEIIALLRSPILVVAILVMPVVQMVVLSGAITFQADNLKLAVQYNPNDVLMTQIYEHAIGTGLFVAIDAKNKDLVEMLQNDDADVVIVAPDGGLTRAVMRNNSELQILIDSVNILKAHSIESYLRGIITQTLLNAQGLEYGRPINFDVRVLFNPQMNTKFFMVPSMVAILVFLALLILISVSITKEKETGTIENLIGAPISKYDIILGKVLPYVVVSFVVMVAIVVVGMLVFGVPFVGSQIMFLMSFLAFCVPACGIGVWLATFTDTQQQAMLGLIIVAFLSLMLSGAIISVENMPVVLRWISYINPLSHYSFLVRNIMLKGPDWVYFFRHAAMMIGVGGLIWIWAIRRFKTVL